jgi:predicted secreted protein
MAVTTGKQGALAVLHKSDVAIAHVRDITGPGPTRDAVEITSRDSTNWFREYLPGFTDPGEITFDVVFIVDSHDPLLTEFAETTTETYKLYFYAASGPDYWSFSGFVTGFEPSAPFEGELTASVTIKATGEITFESS